MKKFVALPWSVYADDPAWVPPLIFERLQHLSPRSPYFQHARWRAWLAYRGAKPVGRISAQVDQLYLERHRDSTGFFGMLEAEDDREAFQGLFSAAEAWLREQGLRRVLGPFSLSINQESGLLVEGFETPPVFMMGHGRPYYDARVGEQGYIRSQDLLAYRIDPERLSTAAIMRSMKAKGSGLVSLRPLRRARLDEDLQVLRDIFNDAWAENWGFVPFTEAEFKDMGRGIARLVDEEFVQIAEVEGKPAAMIILLPNLNESIGDLNGRLLPFGWLKLLWRLKRDYPKSGRVALMGVRRQYQGTLLGTALAFIVIDALREPVMRRGMNEVEMSWILEKNRPMWRIIESLGGTLYKRYRLYEKQLD